MDEEQFLELYSMCKKKISIEEFYSKLFKMGLIENKWKNLYFRLKKQHNEMYENYLNFIKSV